MSSTEWRGARAKRMFAAAAAALAGLVPASAGGMGGPAPGAVTAETVKLPSAPGSVRGLADNASVSAFTGQVQYGVPIELPEGPGGLAPSLSLGYDGGLGNGPLGVGWSISQAEIRRSLRLGVPSFDATDEILVMGLGGGELVAVPSGGYRVEGQGHAFTGVGVDGGFELTGPDGHVYRFGTSAASRKASGAQVAVWHLEQVRDVAGQTIDYRYHQDLGEVYLDSIEWGPPVSGGRAYRAELVYAPRPDSVVSFRTGFRVETAKRLSRIRVWSGGGVRRIVELGYSGAFALSRLESVRSTSADGAIAMPPLTLTYASAGAGQLVAIPGADGWALNLQGTSLFDVDQDGAMDLLRLTVSGHSYRRNQGGTFAAAQPLPGAASASLDKVRLLDMSGDSAAEMVWQQGSQWRIFRLEGAAWVAAGSLAGAANVPLASVTIADVDGDYRMDVLSVAGSMMQLRMGGAAGLASPVVRPAIDPARAFIQPGSAATRFHDINGDGLVDVVYLASSQMFLYLGRGDGTFEKLHDVVYPWGSAVDASQIRLADLNRDGLLDVAVVRAGNVAWHRGLAGGLFDTAPVSLPRPAGTDGSVIVAAADANGNGSEDLVWSSDAGMWILDLAGPTTAGMLVAIENGLGQTQRFTYEASAHLAFAAAVAGAPWSSTAPISIPVSTRARLELASGDLPRSSRLDVRDIVYDRGERRFLGFMESIASRPDPADGAPPARIVRQVQRFAPGLGLDRAIRGQVVYERVEDGSGTVLRESFHDVAAVAVGGLPDEARLRRAITRSTEVHHREGLATAIVTRTEFEHDGEGRVTVERTHGRLDLAGDESIVRTRYTDGVSAAGVRDLVCEERLLAPDPADPDVEILVGHEQTLFGDAAAIAPLCDAATGWQRVSRQFLISEGRWIDVESIVYNARGDPIVRTAGGVTREIEYDALGLHPVAETVHATPTRTLRWQMAWDDVLGQPSLVRDPTGAEVAVTSDGLGRVRGLARGGSAPHIHHRYHHTGPRPYTETFTYERTGAVPALPSTWPSDGRWKHLVEVFDSSGEPMFRAVRLGPSRWLVTDRHVRDSVGRAIALAEPYERTGTLAALVAHALPPSVPTRTASYDALDRVVTQTLPTGEQTTNLYRAFETTVTADGLAPVITSIDGQGRAIRTARTVDGVEEVVEAQYDAAGRITLMSLQGGAAEHRFEYDSLGRLVFASDPDIGDRVLVVDDAGRLVEQTNGAGQTVEFAYDGAGRVTSVTGSGGESLTYHYDDPLDPSFPNTAGRLAWVAEPTGRAEFGYDADGLEVRVRRTVNGKMAERTITRSASGDAVAIAESDGLWYDLAYDPAGRLIRVGSFWQLEEQDAAGRTLRERFGNGAIGTYQRDALGRATHLGVLAPGGAALHDAGVSYGPAGTLDSVTDLDGAGLDHTTSYTYDAGGRLTSALVGAGADQYQFAYQYDGLQNMVRREAHGPTALGILSGEQVHGEDGPGGIPRGPRQLTSIVPDAAAGSPPGAPITTFDYDGAGRMVREGTTTLEYDGFDQLIRVSGLPGGQVTHAYGYNGLRVRTVGPDGQGTTWFSSDVSETDDGVRQVDIRVGERLIARVTRSPDAEATEAAAGGAAAARAVQIALAAAGLMLVLLAVLRPRRGHSLRAAIGAASLMALVLTSCQSQIGSSQLAAHTTSRVLYYHVTVGAGPSLVTREDGSVFEERRYEPFGAPIDSYRALEGGGSSTGPIDFARDPHDILNKQTDPATGWSDHGARWMAPELARWATPDPPVKAPDPRFMTSPWSLHPYQYVNQNPVLYWDPEGAQPAEKDYMPDSVRGYKETLEESSTASGIVRQVTRSVAPDSLDAVTDTAGAIAESLPFVGTYLAFQRGDYLWGSISLVLDVVTVAVPATAAVRTGVAAGRTTVTVAKVTTTTARVATTTARVASGGTKVAATTAKVTAGGAKQTLSTAIAGSVKQAIGWTGKIGEAFLKTLGGRSQVWFRTSRGGRQIDQLVNRVAHESKVGRMSLTKKIREQILKDVELISKNKIDGSVWHFFTSPVTGKGGPTGPLRDFLTKNGIGIQIH